MGVGDYGFISDCQSGALVSRDGSIDWLCLPRFDSPSIFGRLLGPYGGHWQIRPEGPFRVTRHYDGDSLVLVTRFETDNGVVELVDAMALEDGAQGHEIGLRSPHVLLRQVRGVKGTVEVASHAMPRFEYGITTPRLKRLDDGAIVGAGGASSLVLRADVGSHVADSEAVARFTVREGQRVGFSLAFYRTFLDAPPAAIDVDAALGHTTAAWGSWADVHWGEGRGYDGVYRDQVRRSALVLQGLTYQPSGAVAAALTTSLPERAGGEWNWDYRYSWLRDASLMMRALWVAACPDEPEAFFRWIDVAAGHDASGKVQIVYGLEGERDLSEHLLPHLAGFAGARPVRVGNEAWTQTQLDVLGEVLDAAALLDGTIEEWSAETRGLLTSFADYAAREWRREDMGMWELRDMPRPYTSSKVMCWVALDRAVKLADRLGAEEDRRRAWTRERDAIRDTVLREAWSEERQAFTGALGLDYLDASVLQMPLVGFIAANDPRMRSTISVIDRELSAGPLVRRWAEEPNGFMLTSFWLVRCIALLGDTQRARQRLDAILGYANDLGLFAEEGLPDRPEAVGNFPQAFSHVGLINTAWDLTVAEDRARGGAERPLPRPTHRMATM